MGGGFAKMKKIQKELAKMQEEMKNLEVTGSAGSERVTITLSGEREMKGITIHPECVDPEDVEGLQDLIIAAYSDALKKLEEQNPAGGMNLGNLPFGF